MKLEVSRSFVILTPTLEPNWKWKLRDIMGQEMSSWIKFPNQKLKRVKWKSRYIFSALDMLYLITSTSIQIAWYFPYLSKWTDISLHVLGSSTIRNGSRGHSVETHTFLLTTYCSTVCGSDLHAYLADAPYFPTEFVPNQLTGETLPVTLGHEWILYVNLDLC
jgi:hypothetical protein